METTDFLRTRRAPFVLCALQRYYYHHRKTHLPLPLKVVYFIHILQSAQILALLFPPSADLNFPWNYSYLGDVWTGLHLVTSPFPVLTRLGVEVEVQISGFAVSLGCKLAFFVLVGCVLATMRDFDTWLSTSEKHSLERLLLSLDFTLGLFLFRLLYIPINAFLFTHLSTHPSLAFPCFLLLTPMKLLNTAYVGSTSWFTSDIETYSFPQTHVLMWVLDLVYVLLMSVLDYDAQKWKFAGLLTVLGAVKVGKVVLNGPYLKHVRNLLELVKGLVMLWGGIVLFLAILNRSGQDSVLALSLFFLLFPFLFLLFSHLMSAHLLKIAHIQRPSSLFEMEQILRFNISSGLLASAQVSTAFTTAGKLYPDSPQLVLWTLYYYRHLKDVICVQVHISKLMKLKWGVLGYIECYHCLKYMQGWLKTLPEQAEPSAFWEYQENLKNLRKFDYEITSIHLDLFSELSTDFPAIRRVMRLMRKLASKSQQYDSFVQITMKQHPICPELLTLYSGFLSNLSNSSQAGKYRSLNKRVGDSLSANKMENSVDLYDSNCMIIVMSLEPETIGTIIWAQNAKLLGFEDIEMVGGDHCLIVPQPLKGLHTVMLRRIMEFRHHHPVYESRHHLYFAHKSGLLVGAHWKVRLVNMPRTGRLCVVAALKRRQDASTLAFISPDKRTVTAMVTPTQTEGFALRLRNLTSTPNLVSFDLKTVFGEDKEYWKEGKKYMSRPEKDHENSRWVVKAEVLSIFDLYPQPILRMYRENLGPFPSLRPLIEGSGFLDFEQPTLSRDSLIEAELTGNSQTLQPFLNSQQLKMHLKAKNSQKSKKSHYLASFMESNITAFAETDNKSDPHRDLWQQVREYMRFHRKQSVALIRLFDVSAAAVLATTLVTLICVFILLNSEFDYGERLQGLVEACRDRELSVLAALRALEASTLTTNSSSLSFLAETLQTHITDLQVSLQDREHYTQTQGIWLEAAMTGFQPFTVNALEHLKLLALHLNQLAVSLDETGKDFKDLVRNGPSETLSTLNQTITRILQHSDHTSESLIPVLCLLGILINCTVLSLATLLSYRRLTSQRRKLWSLLQSIPRAVYRTARGYAKERLDCVHNEDSKQEDNESGEVVMRSRKLAEFETMQELKEVVGTMTALAAVVVTAIGVVWWLEAGYHGYFHENVPSVLNSASLRKVSLLQVHFFHQSQFHSPSYFSLFPSFQPYFNLSSALLHSLSSVSFYEHNLLSFSHELALQTSDLNSQITDLLFQTLPNPHLIIGGFHNLLLSVYFDLQNDPFSALNSSFMQELYSLSDYIVEKYMEKAVFLMERSIEIVWIVALIAGIGIMIGYLMVIRRVLRKVVGFVTQEWRILTFLPQESGSLVVKLIKNEGKAS